MFFCDFEFDIYSCFFDQLSLMWLENLLFLEFLCNNLLYIFQLVSEELFVQLSNLLRVFSTPKECVVLLNFVLPSLI